MADTSDAECVLCVRVDHPAHPVGDLRESLRTLARGPDLVYRLFAGALWRADALAESRQETAMQNPYERSLESAAHRDGSDVPSATRAVRRESAHAGRLK